MVRRRITRKDRRIDRKDGRKARGSSWGVHRRHRREHETHNTKTHRSVSTRAAISRGMKRYWRSRGHRH